MLPPIVHAPIESCWCVLYVLLNLQNDAGYTWPPWNVCAHVLKSKSISSLRHSHGVVECLCSNSAPEVSHVEELAFGLNGFDCHGSKLRRGGWKTWTLWCLWDEACIPTPALPPFTFVAMIKRCLKYCKSTNSMTKPFPCWSCFLTFDSLLNNCLISGGCRSVSPKGCSALLGAE